VSLIQVDALTKRYGRFKALENASFTVDRGVTGLIGPNGAGKSTLIKIVLGLVRQTGGEARVFGLDSRRDRDRVMQRVGVLHEKPSLPPWVSARQYLEYVARLKRITDLKGEVERVSEICALTNYVDRRIGTFSAGMAQRLGLAGALVGKPDLVVLDEPTANLDPLGRYDVLAKIRKLRDEDGMNFLISTHILSELEKVCNNVVILNEGKVLTYGPFDELISKYSRHKYVLRVDNPKTFVAGLTEETRNGAEVRGDEVLVDVDDEQQLVKELNEMFRSGTYTLREFRVLTPTLEDIFVEAMRRKQVD
jgi:ABC-2 type transport system ATP-binding protein